MSVPLIAAAILSAAIGVAHSFLGERLLLGPLFQRGEVPKLLGSATFARNTLRFAWHLTTVLLIAIGAIVVVLARLPIDEQSVAILRIVSITFGLSTLVSLIGARGKHFSWWVFLAIAVLLWFGA
jgi:hypothetical protein